jgi:hypothetical protein
MPGAENAMQIHVAHIRERAQSGGWLSCCVFDARSTFGSSDNNSHLLARLTVAARAANLRVDHAALAFVNAGRLQFFGSPSLVQVLSKRGLPACTHTLTI